ncbi:MAG: hypothetical protein ACE5E5_08565 [Phycisphaerae bacterium]
MGNGRDTQTIKRIRNEVLVALQVLYPAAIQAEQLLRSLLTLFPHLDFNHIKRDLHYLCAKGYVERVVADSEATQALTPWRKRWFRLTARGVEIVDRCIQDPALEP